MREGNQLGGLSSLIDPDSSLTAADFAKRWARRKPFVFGCNPQFYSALANEFADVDALTSAPEAIFRIGDSSIAGGLRFAKGSEAAAAFATGETTIVAQQVDHRVRWVAQWISKFLEETSLPVAQAKANVFCSPPASGLARHFDNHEVLIIALKGKKRFRLAPNKVVAYPEHNDDQCDDPSGSLASERGAPELPGEELVTLGAGDGLHIPRGWWHRTEAEEPTVSITFGFWSATTGDVADTADLDPLTRRIPIVLDSESGLQQRTLEEVLVPAGISVADLPLHLTKLSLASMFSYRAGLS